MNRFDCLEMPSTVGETPLPESSAPLYDETHYLQMAEQSWGRGDFEKALRHYSKALGLNPNLEEAWLGQVRCLIDLDEIKEARLWVNKALEQMPRSAGLMAAKALVLSRMMEDGAALEQSDKAYSLKQYSWYLWFSRASILLKRRLKMSDYCFLKALEFNPGDWRVNLRIGMAYLEVADYHQALPYIRKAAQAEPTNPLVLFKYGLCCAGMGWVGQAQVHFDRALQQRTELDKEIRQARQAAQRWSPYQWFKGFFNRLLLKEA